jgi:hypothetical protein
MERNSTSNSNSITPSTEEPVNHKKKKHRKKKQGMKFPEERSRPEQICVSDSAPVLGFDDSISNKSFMKSKLYGTKSKSIGTSHLSHIVDSSPNNPPVPVGFVFDDSIKSPIKAKHHDTSPAIFTPTLNQGQSHRVARSDEIDETELHGSDESSVLSESIVANEELSTIPSTVNHHNTLLHSSNNERTHQSNSGQARVVQQDDSSRSSDSSSYSNDIEEGLIIADAVAVEDQEIYDAEPLSNQEPNATNIVINHYPGPEVNEGAKNQGLWGSKFSFPVILVAIVIGASFTIAGIVLRVKKSSANSNTTITNYTNPSSQGISQFIIDDHSQVSNVLYNQTTNHYIIQYNNGTFQESASVLVFIDDEDSMISSLYFNQTSNHYVVQYRNMTVQDVVSAFFKLCYMPSDVSYDI